MCDISKYQAVLKGDVAGRVKDSGVDGRAITPVCTCARIGGATTAERVRHMACHRVESGACIGQRADRRGVPLADVRVEWTNAFEPSHTR